MLWALALLLAFLAPATQVASNLGWGKMSVTRQTGATVTITCDIVTTSSYIHWYQHREGKAPQRLLYSYSDASKFWVDSGFNQDKYDVYKGTGNSFKLVLRKLEESDSGVYYCAAWDRHYASDFPYPLSKTLLVVQSPGPQGRPALVSCFLVLTALL